ncbi:MAG TPA: amino acid racemase [Woeseiaceae bacterium]|jgi:aspartate racemase
MKRKTVGVLGGMGPEATVDFMASVIALTPAGRDQDHIRMLVDHNPGVPDRQAAMRGDRSAVSRVLGEMALKLEAAGADFLVMPCNTAHVFLPEVLPKLNVPFIHIVAEAVAEIAGTQPNARQVGVMATNACIEAGVYQSAIRASGRDSILPPADRQQELMALILRIKRGDKSSEVRLAMRGIARGLVDRGAEVIIAGCTEIPLVLGHDDLDVPFVSSTEVLARRTVAMAIA